jgi:hypothetical protein
MALINTSDWLHQRAQGWSRILRARLATTEAILIEVANGLSKVRWRSLAAKLIREVRADPDVTVVPVTTELFDRGLGLYERRSDKEWSLTDCISFTVMEDRRIRTALAYDHDFVEASFRALLREEPTNGSGG